MGAKLCLTMVDSYGRTTTRRYGMESQLLLADYTTAANALSAALAAVTDLGVVKATLQIEMASLGFAATAGANVDVGAKASGWIDTDLGKKASIAIPGIKPALVSSDGTVPISGAVATFLALFEDAADFNLSDGEQVEGWIRATLDK